jgi:hypothetical protein
MTVTALRSALSSLPRLATRARTSENQMSMFTVISVGAIGFMMLLPSPRAAFASVEPEERVALVETAQSARRRCAPSASEKACAGQVWGAEDMECVLAIARDSGIERNVRFADASFRH